ncbi:MAG: hypothetical protein AAGM22_06715 [Acidobacteriota bacterium]
MKTADIKFGKYRNGLPHFARVVLSVVVPSKAPGVTFSCSGTGGFVPQGYIEEVPAEGYDDWKAGAETGVVFALSAIGQSRCRVDIQIIEGLTTDTNPTIVGYTAAKAVWAAMGVQPPAEVDEKLLELVFSSWDKPYDEIPTFA